MTDQVHDITTAAKSRKPQWLSKKNAYKAAALTIFGGAVALVGYDKLTHRSSKETHTVTETVETTES